MVLDELVYDPATGAGDFAVDMLEISSYCVGVLVIFF